MSNINLDGFLDIASSDDPLQDNDRNGEPSSTPKGHKRKKIKNAHRDFVLKDWLASLSLSEYYNLLYKEGYDKPLSLKVLTDEDLIEIGIKKKGHRLILLNAVKDEYFTSLAANPSFFYGYGSSQPAYRLTHAPFQVTHDQTNHPTQSSQPNKFRVGQLAPMGFVHSDSPSSDSEADDVPEPTSLSNSQHLEQSRHTSSEQPVPQSPHSLYQSHPSRTSPSRSSLHHSPNRDGQSPVSQLRPPPQRFQDDEDEYDDEDDNDQPPTHPQSIFPSPPQQTQNPSALKVRVNKESQPPTFQTPTLHTPPKIPTPISVPIIPSQIPQHPSFPATAATSTAVSAPTPTPAGETAPKQRKRSRPDKPDQPTNTEPDAPPKPKPAAITFIPKQHYSRADVHDCLGGQRFCAISTPSAYPFILIFAHYQAYVGEDGMWEHCASGDLNKGVNRSVIHAKEKKKRLLLFFSMSGQQGAVLFLGEVRYVSSEQREEKNSKGVDKACVIFKFQRISNDAITINLFDYRPAEALAAQPKPVIRSLTEDPNTYYLDATYQSNNYNMDANTTSTTNSNNSNSTNANTSTSTNTASTNNTFIPRRTPPPPVSIARSDVVIPIVSPSLSSSSSSSSSPPLTSSNNSATDIHAFPLNVTTPTFGLLPIKKERAKEEFTNIVPPIPTSTPVIASNTITNLSRTGITKIANDAPSFPNHVTRFLPHTPLAEDDRRSDEGWSNVNNISNFIPTPSNQPSSASSNATSPSVGDFSITHRGEKPDAIDSSSEGSNHARISNLLSDDSYEPSYDNSFTNTESSYTKIGTLIGDITDGQTANCTLENSSMSAESASAQSASEPVVMETN